MSFLAIRFRNESIVGESSNENFVFLFYFNAAIIVNYTFFISTSQNVLRQYRRRTTRLGKRFYHA